MKLPAKEYISVAEAAEAIGVTPARVRQLLTGGELRGVKFSVHAWMVEKSSVEEYSKKPRPVAENRRGRPRVTDAK